MMVMHNEGAIKKIPPSLFKQYAEWFYPASLFDLCLVTFPAGSVWYDVRGSSVATVCALRQQQHGQCCRPTLCAGGILRKEQRTGQ